MSTPKPHNYSSFSYKVTDKRIKNILARRSRVSNTVQISMPFVKATTTVAIEEYLGPGNIGFTLGVHSLPDSGYQSLFEPPVGTPTNPVVGYTYTNNGTNVLVYSTTPSTDTLLGKYFTPESILQSIPDTKGKMPPPGITGLKIGRNRNGLLASAELTISVPTLQQLEYLHRVFLIPGCGMVVEWGQQFAPTDSTPPLQREQMFPWYNRQALQGMINLLARDKFGMEAILRDYVYPTRGQYMWMFGRIATFNTKGNSDGSFDVTVKVVGPSENQWAYSVRQTVLSPSNPDQKPCLDGANSVDGYLTQTTAGGHNFKTLLDDVYGGKILPQWSKHVIQIPDGNKKEGEEGTQSAPNTNQTSFADVDNAYFITWRFFVNVVLNDENYGIKSIFKKANLPDEVLENIRFIRPYNGTETPLDDPYENYVGNNRYLRSFDPGTMIIVNEVAAQDAANDYNKGNDSAKQLLDDIASNAITQQFLDAGTGGNFDFHKSDPSKPTNSDDRDRGLLSTGVWLNHKSVVTSLLSANTILQGISNLLNKMNYATKNYWNLTLDVSEPIDANTAIDYTVVDANYKGSSDQAVKELIEENKIYMFNKFLRETSEGIVGSELIDFSVDLDLPKLLFSQIATMGLSEPDSYQDAKSETTSFQQCKNGTISDANDALRKMFSITTVSAAPGYQSVDLTKISTPKQLGACQNNTSDTTPAGAGGQGAQATSPSPNDSDPTKALKEQQEEAQQFLDDPGNFCKECEPCFKSGPLFGEDETFLPVPVSSVGAEHPTMRGSVAPYQNAQVPLSALTPITGTSAHRVAQSNNQAARGRYQNQQWLEKEAAAQFQKLIEHARATGAPNFTISSAYRDLQHQRDLAAASTGGGVATPGNSPHGMGRAIDFAELFSAANGGSTNSTVNARVRETNALYRWLALNAPAFGWYNPKRLADNNRIDECWHWEYWGYEYPPTNAPRSNVSAPQSGGTIGAVFVTGITRDISEERQIQAFKQGVGQNKRLFTARYTQIQKVKEFLAQNPKTPVFLYSAGANGSNVNALIDDPNIDKQKLFLIEPFFGPTNERVTQTRAIIQDAIRKGLPAANVYAGPTSERGGGSRVIPGSSLVPAPNTHFTAPTYVGQQKAGLVPAPRTTPVSTPSGVAPTSIAQPRPAAKSECSEDLRAKIGSTGIDFALGRAAEIQRGEDRCRAAEEKCKQAVAQIKQLSVKIQESEQYDNAKATAIREFPNLNKILRYIEIIPEHMINKIRCSADGKKSNAFGASPATLSIKAELTLPGIAGLRVGELFWIDKIPAHYKMFGAFQIMSLEEVIGLDGWQTKISAVFNFLGNSWKSSMFRLTESTRLAEELNEVDGTGDVYDR